MTKTANKRFKSFKRWLSHTAEIVAAMARPKWPVRHFDPVTPLLARTERLALEY
jgi:hypothetical protein